MLKKKRERQATSKTRWRETRTPYLVTVNLGPSNKRRKTDAKLNRIDGKNKDLKMITRNG